MIHIQILVLVLLAIYSCTNSVTTMHDCERLSMHSFKGLPEATNNFKKYCQNQKLSYSRKNCEDALVDLVQFGDQNILKKKYGDRIMECFTENDLTKFLKK